MQRLGLFLLVCLFGTTWIDAAIAAVDDGLIGYWSFDACDYLDNSGNGYNDGTAPVQPPVCDPGAKGNALSFNGSVDTYVRIPDVPVAPDQHSYALWFRPATDLDLTSPRQDLLYADVPLSVIEQRGGRPHITLNHPDDDPNDADNGTLGFHALIVEANGTRRAYDIKSSATSWQAGRWHHVAFTWDVRPRQNCASNNTGTANRSCFNVYIDGQLDRTVTQLPGVSQMYTGLRLGIRGDSTFPFDGSLDEVRIYNRVLSAAEVQELAQLVPAEEVELTVAVDGTGTGTVSSVPTAGIACGMDCEHTYARDTMVTLAAVPDSNSAFVGWQGGGCSGTAPCTVFMSQAQAVTATFASAFALTVDLDGLGTGTVTSTPAGIDCGSDCDEAYLSDTVVTLMALAESGSFFTGWSGACTGTAPCTVTMNMAQSVTATFVPTFDLTVTVAGDGAGTVTSTPAGIDCGATCTQPFAINTVVTLSAQPDATSVFGGWSGACSGTAGCAVTLNQAQSVTATFSPVPPVAQAGADQTVNEGTLVTLSGSGTSPSGETLSYAWTQSSGPVVTLSIATSPQAIFTAPAVDQDGAVLTFVLTVTDAIGGTAADSVAVTVLDTNLPPVASAGPDQTVTENTTVALDGSASSDLDSPEGRVASFDWVQSAGPPVVLSDPQAAQPTFRAPLVGLSSGFQPGDTLPGFVLKRQPSGSLADVGATGTYDAGQWSVMLTRTLTTSDLAQDVQFDLSDATRLYPFSIAYLDNTGAQGPRQAAAAVMSVQDTKPYALGNEASDADLRARRETPVDCGAFSGEPLVTQPTDPTVVPVLTLRAAYDDSHVYLCVTAPDPNGVADVDKEHWTFTGPEASDWQRLPGTVNAMGGMVGQADEDRLAIWWDMGVQDFATEGCQALCHDQRMQSKNADGRADLWHWQAARTNPAGFAADEGLAPSLDCDQPCRQADAATEAISTPNARQVDALTLPSFVASGEPGAEVQALFADAVPPGCPPEVCALAVPAALLDEVLQFALTVSDSEGLEDSDEVTIRVVEAGERDTDVDGVPNHIEDQAPNGGDGNRDGIADRRQAHVTSLPNAMDGRYVTLESPEGTLLAQVEALPHPSPADAPEAFVFPVGFFTFEVLGLAPGVATRVTLWLPEGIVPEAYYKFGPTPDGPTPHWYDFAFDGTTGAELQSDRVILHMADGQRGDHDLVANGTVVDPGGVAVRQSDFTLSVRKAGTGVGTVTSGPAGIACGATCDHAFVVGTTVTLSAEPEVGSGFTGWQGACSGTAACTVTMVEALEVTAVFDALSTPSAPSDGGGGGGSGGGGCALTPGAGVDPMLFLLFVAMVGYLIWRRQLRHIGMRTIVSARGAGRRYRDPSDRHRR